MFKGSGLIGNGFEVVQRLGMVLVESEKGMKNGIARQERIEKRGRVVRPRTDVGKMVERPGED